jgi:colanic acid/amylovoran biosynthesis protein
MKIVIVNGHSTLNTGDAAIILAQARFLKERFSPLELALTSRTPERDAEFYRPLGIRVFPPLLPAPSVFEGPFQRVGRTARNLGAAGIKRKLIEEIRTSDLVISCGGGYFWSDRRALPGPMFFQNLVHVWVAGRLKKPIVFFPQSFGPLRSRPALRLLKRALEQENVIRVFAREKASLNFLRGLLGEGRSRDKLELCPDMAFCHSDKPQLSAPPQGPGWPRPALALTLRQWSFPQTPGRVEKKRKQREYLEALAEACRRTAGPGRGSIVLFAHSRGPGVFEDDRRITSLFRERLRRDIPEGRLFFPGLPLSVHPFRIMDFLEKMDAVVATRLHSAILGLLSGIPVLAVAYQPKTGEVMESLGLAGLSLDIDELTPDALLAKLGEVLDRNSEIREKIKTSLHPLKPLIEKKLEAALERFR